MQNDSLSVCGIGLLWMHTILLPLLYIPSFGPLLLIAFRMIGEVFSWLTLVSGVVVAIGVSLHLTYSRHEVAAHIKDHCEEVLAWHAESWLRSMRRLVHLIFDPGAADLGCFEQSDRPYMGTILVFCYLVLVVLLSLNMCGATGGSNGHATLPHPAQCSPPTPRPPTPPPLSTG